MIHKDIFISRTASIKEALKKLNQTAEKVLLISDDKRTLLGTITDGDIRRYILSGKSLENDIDDVYNRNPIYMKKEDFSADSAKDIFLKNRIELLPILDGTNKIVDFATWSQLFAGDKSAPSRIGKIGIPVVIMAGGKGSRMEPFTRILPKPLIPIGDKSIIETIIDEFKNYGVSEFYVTLNYKSEMIKAYFNSIEKDYKIRYVTEDDFLGTAGSLKLLEKDIEKVFIVSNCDVIVKTNLEDVLNFHKEKGAALTIISSLQHYRIPYGVIKFKEGGEVTSIHEKPEYSFNINTGVYMLGKDALKFIPERTPFDMTDLIKRLIEGNKKIFIYPVNEKDYIDIGQWEEYQKAIKKLQLFT